MKVFETIVLFINVLGCLNYGILAVFNYNLLNHLFIDYPALLKILYFLFGLSAMILISSHYEKK